MFDGLSKPESPEFDTLHEPILIIEPIPELALGIYCP